MMQAKAIRKYARGSAYKARLVASLIRNKKADQAREILKFSKRRAAKVVMKTLDSAIANAEHNHQMDIDLLWISQVCIDDGVRIKRWRTMAKGRGTRIIKRTCHVTIKLEQRDG